MANLNQENSPECEAAVLIKPNDSLSSLERLEIYNRQYWFRLYSSFEDDFQVFRQCWGADSLTV
jgi:hypothetical protein